MCEAEQREKKNENIKKKKKKGSYTIHSILHAQFFFSRDVVEGNMSRVQLHATINEMPTAFIIFPRTAYWRVLLKMTCPVSKHSIREDPSQNSTYNQQSTKHHLLSILFLTHGIWQIF